MGAHDYQAEVSRAAQVAAGIALTFFSIFFLLCGLGGLFATLRGGIDLPGAFAVFASLALVGAGGTRIGVRLVLGRRRKRDGGLFSPSGLRLAALLWLVAFGVLAWLQPIRLLELAFAVSAATAMYVLANRREQGLSVGASSGELSRLRETDDGRGHPIG